jgi:hypothetical protein
MGGFVGRFAADGLPVRRISPCATAVSSSDYGTDREFFPFAKARHDQARCCSDTMILVLSFLEGSH